MRTAIILVNYNSLEDTKDCLVSIKTLEGTRPFVVLVDNKSNNEEEILALEKQYDNLKVILNGDNIGFGKANNIGIQWILQNTDCAYIFILNNDTTLEKDCLLALKGSIEEQTSNKTVVAPLILNIDKPPTVWYAGGVVNWKLGSAQVDFIRFSKDDKEVTESRQVAFASGCAMFFRSDFLRHLGGFDPYFFMYEEDVELSLRILKEGGKIIYEPKAIVNHKCQGSATTKTTIRNQLHPANPNLNFYLEHIILGRVYNVKMHGTLKQKTIFGLYSFLYWNAKSFQYLLKGNVRSFILVYKYWFKGVVAV